jgi:hypothetical protein
MSAHTPGPWQAAMVGMDAVVIASDGRQFKIGDIVYHSENMPNARLVAAAPDLLTAVNGFRWLGNNLHNIKAAPDSFRGLFEAALEDAIAAVAKAEGR